MPDQDSAAAATDPVGAAPADSSPADLDPAGSGTVDPDGAGPDRAASDSAGPDRAASDSADQDRAASDDAPPTEDWLLAHAREGRVRRAPRIGAWTVAGALAGLVVGTVLSLAAIPSSGLSPDEPGGVLPMLGGYTGVTVVTALALGVLGGLLGAGLALLADRRS